MQLIDAMLEKSRRTDTMRLPTSGIPAEMRDAGIPSEDDWSVWKPIDSNVTDADLDRLETIYEMRYPPLYRALLKYKHYLELVEGGVSFARHSSRDWELDLYNLYQCWIPKRMIDIGLIPFGDEALMDAGPVCFDVRSQSDDPPVVYWDHEFVGTDKEVAPMFSSTTAMFRCLTFAASHDVDFWHHDPTEDDSEELPEKIALLRQFLSLDPSGAGGVALNYWACWGVSP